MSSPRRSFLHSNCALPFAAALIFIAALSAACGGGSTGPQQQQPPPPAFTNIDAPGAGTAMPQGTYAVGITDNGNVVGYFIDGNGVFHGFVRTSAGAITVVDAPSAALTLNNGTLVTAMNGSGEAGGYYSDSQGFLHSFTISSGGTLTEFDPPNTIGSSVLCINDSGVFAGGLLDVNGRHGYVRATDGTFAVIDPTGNPTQVTEVLPNAINASGQVVGRYIDTSGTFHGFFRDTNGAIAILDAPGAPAGMNLGTEADGIDSSGVIVGGISLGTVNGVVGTTHSLIRAADGTYTVFDPPQSGAHSSIAEGINDDGVVVGEYRDANLVRHGYIRSPDGTFTSFDDPNAAQLPLSNATIGTDPRHINASGAVAGFYSDANGVRHAFIRQ